ncbi:DUF4389 domain-containing protein [Prauserella flavalba]|uniref:DUF4389 domain-containing protein n=1 Tax=Prauserella flavalba TaxID=1477506 RepID=UPI0036EA7F9C
MADAKTYPVRVEAELDPGLSRWLWLVKWLLAIPHYLVLSLLWLAFGVLTVVAFFAILVTGRYPRGIFDFNVGVLRWAWRVHYYAYAGLGTDRYPPFTLAEVPDYPAHLDIDYPTRLSRGLVLVKWWLLAIPHYIVVGLFAGGGLWLLWWPGDNDDTTWAGGGLIGILVLVAGVVLLFTGSYPRPVYDFVLGMDRWVVRVAAYAALMIDEYPPFRLDLGGSEQPSRPEGPAPVPQSGAAAARPRGWTPGRITAVVVGALLALVAMGPITGGIAMLWADRTQRDADGFLTASGTFDTGTYALATEAARFAGAPEWVGSALGDVRIRAVSTDPGEAIFVGIAPSDEAARYLAGTEYATVREVNDGRSTAMTVHSGSAPATPPATAGIWTAQSSGTGIQTVRTPVDVGDWSVVVLNADRSRGVSVRAEAGATVPALPWVGGGALALGVVLLGAGGLLVGRAAHLAAQHPRGSEPPAGEPTRAQQG